MTNVVRPPGAKYWLSDLKTNGGDLTPQLFARHGYSYEYSILPQYRAAPFRGLCAAIHEIMKGLIACNL
jgi:hypothetical protein